MKYYSTSTFCGFTHTSSSPHTCTCTARTCGTQVLVHTRARTPPARSTVRKTQGTKKTPPQNLHLTMPMSFHDHHYEQQQQQQRASLSSARSCPGSLRVQGPLATGPRSCPPRRPCSSPRCPPTRPCVSAGLRTPAPPATGHPPRPIYKYILRSF